MRVLWEREIKTGKIRVSPRPVWKCMTCPMYGKRPGCPPNAPSWRETKQWVKSFERAILVKFEIDMKNFKEEKRKVLNWLLRKERELFRQGNMYAFALFPGSCNLCEDCPYERGKPCRMPEKVRPSVDAVGIELTSIIDINFSESVLYGIVFID